MTYVFVGRVSGLSPFMGDTDLETMANVTIAEYDYEDEAFDSVSQEAREFIDSLLVKDQTYVSGYLLAPPQSSIFHEIIISGPGPRAKLVCLIPGSK